MTWICFGDSACGGLHQAARSIAPDLPSDQIIGLADDWSRGSIDRLDADARNAWICPACWRAEFGDTECDGWLRAQDEALARLETVREAVIWYGENPLERCGLDALLFLLAGRGIPVTVVPVDRMPFAQMPAPEPTQVGYVGLVTENRMLNGLLSRLPQRLLRRMYDRRQRRAWLSRSMTGEKVYRGVGEASPTELQWFWQKCRRLTEEEIQTGAAEWMKLKEENAPLRVLRGGVLHSASADYYDETILTCVPQEEKSAAWTVGTALSQLPVSDTFVFERICVLAAQGQIQVVQPGETYRDMTICRMVKCS